MGTFKSSKTLYFSPSLISGIAGAIETEFRNDGFEVQSQPLVSGGYDISVAKGGMFKAVLGLKSALKISLEPRGGNIFIEAGVGIFGQQAVPTAISMLFLWPVLITQIWGMVRQSNLDERAIEIAESYIARQNHSVAMASQSQFGKFCTTCGAPQSDNAKFCNSCGAKM